MECPACKTEYPVGNFCIDCGSRLQEKCPDCGKMEPVGREVCQTKLTSACKMHREYLGIMAKKASSIHTIVLSLALAVWLTLAFFWLFIGEEVKNPPARSTVIGFGIALIFFVIAKDPIQNNVKKRANKYFCSSHPTEAALLKLNCG